MKKKIGILMASAALLASCGTASYTSSSGQRFEDGIYSRPRPADSRDILAEDIKTDALVQKTRSSEIYLASAVEDGHKTDTLYIPEDKSAIINFSGTGTSVTITDDPFDQVYFNSYPWTYYRPYTFSSFYWDPWYYGRYWGYYDPWYWSGWPYYGSWYWGIGFAWDPWLYDPWFWGPAYPWYPHYCGWYGGWGPGLGWHGPGHVHGGHGREVYFGHRGSTTLRGGAATSLRPRSSTYSSGSGRRAVSGTRAAAPSRSGVTSSSSSSRRYTGSSGNRTYGQQLSSGRRFASGNRSGIIATDRPATRPSTGGVTSGSSSGNGIQHTPAIGGRRSVQSYRNTGSSTGYRNSLTSGQQNYRRPASSYNRSASASYGTSQSFNRGAYYNRSQGGSSYNRSATAPSYNRSTTTYSRPSSSVSRSSSFSGSRSSGFSGGSRSGGGGSSSVRRR